MKSCAVSVLVAAAVGCATDGVAPPAAATSTAAAPGAPPVSDPLAHARKLAADARGIVPPRVPPTVTGRGEYMRWLKGEGMAWIVRRRQVVEAAEAEYGKASSAGPTALRAVALKEAGDCWRGFVEALAELVSRPADTSTEDPESRAGFDRAARAAITEPARKRMAELYRMCADLGPAGGTVADGCNRELAKLTPAQVAPSQALKDWEYLGVDVPKRPRKKTTFPSPCVLSGSLYVTHGRVYSSPDGDERVLGIVNVEVETLEIPSPRAGRFRVVLSWPVRAEGWLDPGSLPLENTKRISVKEPHLWLEPGARLFAWRSKAGATVARPLEYERLDRVFEAERPCTELVLGGTAPDRTTPKNYLAGPAALFASVDGARIADLNLDFVKLPVKVLERNGNWSRVRALSSSYTFNVSPYIPWDLEGWTNGSVTDDSGFAFATIGKAQPPSHRVSSPFPLRAEPRPAANVVAQSVRGVPIKTGREENGFVALKLVGAAPGNKYSEFWAEKSAITQATEPW